MNVNAARGDFGSAQEDGALGWGDVSLHSKSPKTALTHPAPWEHYGRVRKLYRESQNTFRQGARWPTVAGCVLAWMLFATSAVANPQLDPGNPTGFFTNVAMALFQQMGLRDFNGNLVTVTNIPIYQDPTIYGNTNRNYYTPAVHRILQVAANILDATTNRFIGDGPTNYPTVFRPVFTSQNGQVWISGYQEVTDTIPLNFQYWDPAQAAINPGTYLGLNIYGVPWVIGAKKGFPNFNEFSMDNPLSISRKLTFTNALARPPWITNQVLGLSITNSFGVEAWNSYTNAYGRPLLMIVSNTMSITISNQNNLPLLVATNLSFGNILAINGWSGWSASNRTLQVQYADNSFIIPLVATNAFTNGIYESTSPYFIPLGPPVYSATFVPHLFMALENKLQFILIDQTANRVIDFVNIDSQQPVVDIAWLLQGGDTGTVPSADVHEQWDTNLLNGVPIGILNQIYVGQEAVQSSDWVVNPQPPFSAQQVKDQKANIFRNRLMANPGYITNYFEAPYTPYRTIHQRLSWQANDPLVHYMAADITSTNGMQQNWNTVDEITQNMPLPNLGMVNYAYQPWGGNHAPGGSPIYNSQFDFDYRVKDPKVEQSDDWNFPTGESLSFEWLGRVHRGTPWQTIDLKPSQISLHDWPKWNNDYVIITNGAPGGNGSLVDGPWTHPVNDWQIASLWAQWLNTNDLSALLSINNTDPNAWAAQLDGLTALTNSTDGLDPITISSNSLQAGIIAQGIQIARANTNGGNGTLVVFPNQSFHQVGDVLATPELSVASPFINTNGLNSLYANGITDESLEKIPTQLLPLLRLDFFGQIVPANGQLQLSFSGYDGHAYAIETSSNFTDWVIISTNYPSDEILGIGNFGITNTPAAGQQFYRSILLH